MSTKSDRDRRLDAALNRTGKTLTQVWIESARQNGALDGIEISEAEMKSPEAEEIFRVLTTMLPTPYFEDVIAGIEERPSTPIATAPPDSKKYMRHVMRGRVVKYRERAVVAARQALSLATHENELLEISDSLAFLESSSDDEFIDWCVDHAPDGALERIQTAAAFAESVDLYSEPVYPSSRQPQRVRRVPSKLVPTEPLHTFPDPFHLNGLSVDELRQRCQAVQEEITELAHAVVRQRKGLLQLGSSLEIPRLKGLTALLEPYIARILPHQIQLNSMREVLAELRRREDSR